MFLLHIVKNKREKDNLLQVLYLKSLLKKLKEQMFFFKKMKKNKIIKNLRFNLLKKNQQFLNFKSNNLIKYIMGISIYATNLVIYLSDIKGKIKFFCTAGSLGLNKKEKKKKVAVLIKLVKAMIFKIKFVSKNDLIALHLRNFNEKLGTFILSFLIKYYNIETIKINNNQPHNGCRPRKLKRKRRRKLNFN